MRPRAADRRVVEPQCAEVYAVARKILGTHEDADEAAQEAFVRAWRALGRFRGDSALRTWLIRIVINVSRSMLAARREAGEPPEMLEVVPDPREGSDETVWRRQLQGRVRAAVATLPPRQREVVWLKVFCEMKYDDVGRTMGISEGAAKAHLHQAVSNLRRRMSEEREGEQS